MTSLTGREGLLSRSLAASSNRMERLLGLSSRYAFASAGENHEELREEDVWFAGGADEDFGDEKKKTRNYFQLRDDFGDEMMKTKNDFHLHEDFGGETKKMMNYFNLQEDINDQKKKMKNYFHLREDFGDEKEKMMNYFGLQDDLGDEKEKMKNYFHVQEDFGDQNKKTKNYLHLQEDLKDEKKKMKNYLHLQEDLKDEKKKMKNYFHLLELGDEKMKMNKYFHSGKNSASIVKLSDGLGIPGLSVAFEDPAPRSCDVSFVSASRLIPRVETLDAEEKGIIYQSAPVNVPDWTKILGIHHRHAVDRNIFTVDDDDLDDDERLPPHEYLAREHARSHVDATSVLEGVGRKLKGRDLSRVRNAVWNQTGFLG